MEAGLGIYFRIIYLVAPECQKSTLEALFS